MNRTAYTSETAPMPADSYNIAVAAGGLVFLAGQTARPRQSPPWRQALRLSSPPDAGQPGSRRQRRGPVLEGRRARGRLPQKPANAPEFDALYKEYVGDPLPARTLTQSTFADFEIEVDAVLVRRG
jgi:2-iminobutanoate/2-iminopropanoate deaminase